MRSALAILGVCLVGSIAASAVAALPPTASVRVYQKISDLAGNFTATMHNSDEFGGSVAALGDLDGAGPSVMAMAVSAGGDDDGGSNRGAVYILFLNKAGSCLSYSKISSTSGNFGGTLDTDDDFGSSLAYLGDLDGPGPSVAALAVGTAGDDDGGTDRGAVYILFLNSAGSVLSYQKISDLAGNFTATLHNADEFGGSVTSLGDLDGAGPSAGAIAVGTAGDDDGGLSHGAVYVLFLSTTGTVTSYQKISSLAGGFTATLDVADEFGSSVAGLGDLDGAGASAGSLAVGTVGDDDGGTDRGAVYVLFLNGSGSVLSYQKLSQTVGGLGVTLHNLDEFGGAVGNLGRFVVNSPASFGTIAGTLAVGAIGDDDLCGSCGATYVLFLNSSGSAVHTQKISGTAGGFGAPLELDDEFGGAVTGFGDIDGRFVGSAAVVASGASFDDDGGIDRGAVYVMFLQPDPVGVAEGPAAAPRYLLGLASPNPFNPITRIPYQVADSSPVEIGIWDVSGRLVRTLVQGRVTPGAHTTSWDGIDFRGRPVASGPYFFRMLVDGRAVAAAQRVVLLK